MKVVCTAAYDIRDANKFGGRAYYSMQALSREIEDFDYISPLYKPLFHASIFKCKNAFYKLVRKKRYSFTRDKLMVQEYSRQIRERLKDINADIIVSPITFGSQPIAYLDCQQPIVIWTDSTFSGLTQRYPQFHKDFLCSETYQDGIENERLALSRSSLAIYWSEWSAKTAIDTYHLDPSKVKVVPVGAEVGSSPNFEEICSIISSRSTNVCKLLFVGIDWERKGGSFAVKVVEELNRSGIRAEITIVGCNPVFDRPIPDWIKVVGYIRKSSPEGLAKLRQLFYESHFFILPSKAEAMGLVFCEASAFGLPSITTNIDGIPTVVKDGINGKMFSLSASVDKYCEYISSVFSDRSQYEELALSSYMQYQSCLNPSAAARTVKDMLAELI
jgi:glycosyltransferase involved in cell wall biosynthesis